MPKLLINLRGTSGSGKTTVARGFINGYPHEDLRKNGKIAGVRVDVSGWNWPLFIIGRYNVMSGGMDRIDTQDECAELAKKAYAHGHVLGEGLLATGAGPNGTLAMALAEVAGPNVRFLSLDTPLEVCLERIKARRAGLGIEKPFNPRATVSKYESTISTHAKFEAANIPCAWVDHTRAYEQVFEMLREADFAG